MIKKITINGRDLEYTLTYKKVKNINLRINPGGGIFVSADKRVPQEAIEAFILSKGPFIQKALKKYATLSQKEQKQYVPPEEIRGVITGFCEKIYPHFEKKGIAYPKIKFRKMTSQWGNCHFKKGVVTFNTNLIYAPLSAIEYVVCHEFTHFLVPNHSRAFYEELSKVCPDFKEEKKKLKEICLL